MYKKPKPTAHEQANDLSFILFPYADCISNAQVAMSSQTMVSEDEEFNFSTIDGNVVTYYDGASAVSNGAGIFIGDYFVGIVDNILSSCNIPFIQY